MYQIVDHSRNLSQNNRTRMARMFQTIEEEDVETAIEWTIVLCSSESIFATCGEDVVGNLSRE